MNERRPTLSYEPRSPSGRGSRRWILAGVLVAAVLTLVAAEAPTGKLLVPSRGGVQLDAIDLIPLAVLTALLIGAGTGFWRREVQGFGIGLLVGGVLAGIGFFYLLWFTM